MTDLPARVQLLEEEVANLRKRVESHEREAMMSRMATTALARAVLRSVALTRATNAGAKTEAIEDFIATLRALEKYTTSGRGLGEHSEFLTAIEELNQKT